MKSKTVYAPGCWDLLHIGHVRFLKEAAIYGKLFVGVPSDEVVLEDKKQSPIIPCEQRIELIESLYFVEGAFRYNTLDFLSQLYILEPDYLAVGEFWGTDFRHRTAEAFMQGIDGILLKIPYCEKTSTTKICSRVKELR